MTLSVLDRYRTTPVAAAGRLLVDGRWRDGTGERWAHRNPATGEHLTDVAITTPDEVGGAVGAARRAFDEGPWPRMRARERQALLRRAAELVRGAAAEINALQTLDNGMPITRSSRYRSSALIAADLIDYYAGWTDKLHGETYPPFTADDDLQFLSVLEPVGVVAAVIPWNAPVLQFANKVAPALAAGCTIVLKPSEYASLAVLRLAELIAEAGLPDGVFNVVTGTGEVTGEALVTHPGIDKIAFTGSRAIGERMVRASADGIKRVTLELGGKSPALVFPDAPDLAAVAKEIGAVVFHGLSGQTCSAQTRALVHRSVHADFVTAVVAEARRVVHGDPFDPATTAAPIINARQLTRIESAVEGGIVAGAIAELRGRRADGPLAAGNWLTPTVLTGVDNTGALARTEVFGPVLGITAFDTEDEAIALANDTPYGLSAGVYTGSAARALRVANRLRTGTVGVNGYTFMPNSPFGGFKASGMGREGGRQAIDEYLETKTIMIRTSEG
jgi:aldehyde dehydrogenase (NAD+)